MVCIQTGKSIQRPNRMKFEGTGFYVKSHDEMYQVFKDSPGRARANSRHRGALPYPSLKRSAIRFRTSMCPPGTPSTAISSM